MRRAGISSAEIDMMLNEDSEYKAEYERLKPRYELIAQIIHARNEQKITQAEMAERMGTKNPISVVLRAAHIIHH